MLLLERIGIEKRFITLCLFTSLFLSAQDLLVKTDYPKADGNLGLSSDDCCWYQGSKASNFSIRHLEYQGIGFEQGYTTFELFLANSEPWFDHSIFFLDLRGHVFNDGNPAVNIGGGWRWLVNECQAFGINSFYDFRKTKHKKYNQAGLGLEYLTPKWELRANGYFPFGSKVSHPYDLNFSHFGGNQLFVSQKHEFAMIGADTEFGWHFRYGKNFDLFAGAGPYYFQGHLGGAAVGGKLRFEAKITPYVTLEVGDSYDSVFNNRFHAELTLSIPFGPRAKVKSGSCCSCADQIAFQQRIYNIPNRQEIIVVDHKKKTSAAIDPVTGLPFFFLFVDNTSSSNGTYESPYRTLAAAQSAASPGDVIYVFPGDQTTNGMDAGIDLSLSNTERVRLLSSGVTHQFISTVGSIEIPSQSFVLPSITNLNPSPIVTLGLDNEVSGFNLVNGSMGVASVSGIWNGVSTSANINRNNIIYSGGIAVDLQPTNSQVNLQVVGNYIFAPSSVGINAPFVSSSGNVFIQSNMIDSSTTLLGSRGIQMIHSGANVVAQINQNTIYNMIEDSIYIDAGGIGTVLSTTINENTIFYRANSSGVNYYAVQCVSQNDAMHSILLESNSIYGPSLTVTQYYNRSVLVDVLANTTTASNTTVLLNNNFFVAGGEGVIIIAEPLGAGGIVFSAQNNDFESCFSSSSGVPVNFIKASISINADGLGPFSADLRHNFINGDSGENSLLGIGIHVDTVEVHINCKENQIHNSNQGLIYGSATGGGILHLDVEDNLFELNPAVTLSPYVNVLSENGSIIHVEYSNNNSFDFPTGDILATTNGAMSKIILGIHGNRNTHGLILDTNSFPGGTIYLETPFDSTGAYFVDGTIIYINEEEEEVLFPH